MISIDILTLNLKNEPYSSGGTIWIGQVILTLSRDSGMSHQHKVASGRRLVSWLRVPSLGQKFPCARMLQMSLMPNMDFSFDDF